MDDAAKRARLKEGLWVWALAFGSLMVARYLIGPAVPFVANNLKAVAVLGFLYLPLLVLRRRGEDLADHGFVLARWREDLKVAAKVSLVLFPPFVFVFWGFMEALRHVPEGWMWWIGPWTQGYEIRWALPNDFAILILTQVLVVAVPEEFFYRGYLYDRFAEAFDEVKARHHLWGVPIGRAFWLQAALFAIGHLTEPYPWRLAVFFPALLFCWVRVRTGTILAAAIVHALSNLVVMVLQASFFGG